jgi:hypothetical protein
MDLEEMKLLHEQFVRNQKANAYRRLADNQSALGLEELAVRIRLHAVYAAEQACDLGVVIEFHRQLARIPTHRPTRA